MNHPVEKILGYEFTNVLLLEQALTHPSCSAKKQGVATNYQRLEFLGDSVLGLAISDLLFRHYPMEAEGALARRKAALVEGKMLARQMQEWEIAPYIFMSAGEEAGGGRNSQSILEDVCEAMIGAVYLDGGYDAAYKLIQQRWQKFLESNAEAPKDAKTALQEWVQGQGLPLPKYTLLSAQGPAHEPVFIVSVEVSGQAPQQAEALSKRKAEQAAAAKMLSTLMQA